MRIVTIILVLALLAGGAWYMGWLKVGKDGTITTAPPAAPEMDDYQRGDVAFGLSNYAEAIDKYQKAIKADPKNTAAPEAAYRIAKSLDEQKKAKEAAAAYKDFVAKYPNHDATQIKKAKDRADFLANSSN